MYMHIKQNTCTEMINNILHVDLSMVCCGLIIRIITTYEDSKRKKLQGTCNDKRGGP